MTDPWLELNERGDGLIFTDAPKPANPFPAVTVF
jgi:hypothetical protein